MVLTVAYYSSFKNGPNKQLKIKGYVWIPRVSGSGKAWAKEFQFYTTKLLINLSELCYSCMFWSLDSTARAEAQLEALWPFVLDISSSRLHLALLFSYKLLQLLLYLVHYLSNKSLQGGQTFLMVKAKKVLVLRGSQFFCQTSNF